MSNKLPVGVVITTYDPGDNSRYNLLYQTVQSLVSNLIYENLFWIISDDSTTTPQIVIDTLSKMIPSMNVSFFNTSRRGVGFSKNLALKEAFKVSNLAYLTEDDWWLSTSFDLLPHVQVMLDNPNIGICRFGFLGGNLTADYVDYGPFLTYWKLKPASGFYCYSGQNSLRSYEFYKKVGWHAENCTPGQEEEEFCWRYNKTENPPDIVWPANIPSVLNSGPFKNIGLGSSTNGVVPNA